MVAISESISGAHVQDAAGLLLAAEKRQRSLLQQLTSGLASCKGLIQANSTEHVALAALARSGRSSAKAPATDASSKIDAAAGVDLVAVKALIAESNAALAAAL